MKLYLSSYDYKDFEKPRKVIRFQKIILCGRSVLEIDVRDSLIGQKYGLSDMDISKFYLIDRFDENSFEELNKFPIEVHVLIKKEFKDLTVNSLDQLQNIAWAILYDNKKDATEKRI